MTQLKFSNGGADSSVSAAHISGDAKIVPLDENLLVRSINQISNIKINGGEKTEKVDRRFFQDDIFSEKIYDHVDSCSEDDDFCEKIDEKLSFTSSEDSDERFSTNDSNGNDDGKKLKGGYGEVQIIIPPNSQLPRPEAPPGVTMNESESELEKGDVSGETETSWKYFLEKSSSLSSAITKRLYSYTDNNLNTSDSDRENSDGDLEKNLRLKKVSEFLSGVKLVVNSKSNDEDDDHDKTTGFRGRITFFSKSNCRDCTAVRSFFREKNLRYVEINIDVFPLRKKELIERTGCLSVPHLFFNEKSIGGLVALNSLRNSGMLEEKLMELLSEKCPDTAPVVPVYGIDDPEEDDMDEMVEIVRVLRQTLFIQDRVMKMKMIRNCFCGAEMVNKILKHYAGLERLEAVEIGKQLARKHFIHHVFGENDFEDGNHYYRFLEHEPFIVRCFNYQVSINDSEPKAAVGISQRLTKLMFAILESYASEDRQHLNYTAISTSEELRRYVNLVKDLHRVDLLSLSAEERLAFFLNLYNAMVIHAVIKVGHPAGMVDRRSFNNDFLYVIGGQPYSLGEIKHGILRSNRRVPYSLVKSFGAGDKRLALTLPKVNPSIHFGLCDATRSSPVVRFFTPQGVDSELRYATREFFKRDGIEVDLEKRTVYLTRIITWFNVDFGQEKEILQWLMKYLDATEAGLLTHLLEDGGPVNIVYQDYDWSVNS
ncbi:DEP domain-containing protein [Heracleum sosnowskyi]|uniref:DEP domain-containing protein n=1 Tax=Heracleum sosnowskyi TaxID=360622 RepID=A0AAD8ILR4_9APIA|nr:DEP domain-containing protein [Heracleum sosnowskyi]